MSWFALVWSEHGLRGDCGGKLCEFLPMYSMRAHVVTLY